MRFALLGPLVVADDTGERIVVAGTRQRSLLACLLVRANTAVSGDSLIEAVWDGKQSSGSPTMVRSVVMRLRRALGPRVAARIVARPQGYLIRVEEAELDLFRFEALCREADAAQRDGAWIAAADAASAAEALWRGEPLADISSLALRDLVVPRFERLRLQTLELGTEAGLRLGRHEQLVPLLRELADAHPLRERFHVQLMEALARSGRRAEALEVYRDARRHLVEQLGIEPGAELRSLHEHILSGESEQPAGAPGEARADSAQAAPADDSVVRQLPAAPRYFIGRRLELEALIGLSAQPADGAGAAGGTVAICTIDGMGGIGKSALAVHAAYRLAERFPDGQLFLDLHGYTEDQAPRTPRDALQWLLRALGVPPQRIPQELDAAAALYRHRLAHTRTLIVLDNVADEAQVRPLLPGGGECLVLITSRRRLKGLDDAHSVSLELLPLADAVALLRAVAGADRIPDEGPAADEIAELCGRLPLALRVAGVLLRHRPGWSLEHLAALLSDRHHRVQALSDGERDLARVFDLSYAGLDEQHRELFRRLGVIPGPDLDPEAAAALLATDTRVSARLLEDLVDHHLLVGGAPDRYRPHDLIHAYARTLAARDPADERRAALGRLLDYYQRTALVAEGLVSLYHSRPLPDTVQTVRAAALPDAQAAWAWLRTERPNLLAALEHTAGQGDSVRVVALAAGLATLLRVDGPWSYAAFLHTAAADAAGRLGDHAGQAAALTELGRVKTLMGERAAAAGAASAALELYRRVDDRPGQAAALALLGEIRTSTGDRQAAMRDQTEALRLYRELDDRFGQAATLARLGSTGYLIADYQAAERQLEQALALYRELGERNGQATALTRLGQVRFATGDHPGAIRDQEAALRLYRDLGHQGGQGTVLVLLGQVRTTTEDYRGALRDLEEALRIERVLEHEQGRAGALAQLGNVRRLLGDHPGALRALEEAVTLLHDSGARGNEAWALNLYAAALKDAGHLPRAQGAYSEALRLAREVDQADDEALALEGLGECDLATGRTETGSAGLARALEIFQRLGMTPDTDRVQSRLDGLARR